MSLEKRFSSIKVDDEGREYVVHRASGVRYYLNRAMDPKLRGTSGLSLHPPKEYNGRSVAPTPKRAPVIEPAHSQPQRRVIVARFVKGSAPRRHHADC